MNKQELIEKAVIDLNGIFPDSSKRCVFLCVGDTGFLYASDHSATDTAICHRSEFETTAKRMGYINGYEWGKEYPTNGKKPDLASGTMVEAKRRNGKWHEDGEDNVDDFNWDAFSHFRITDKRYKPAEPAPDKTWFEAVELPPVGTVCEYAIDGGHWWPCEIRYIVGDEGVVMWVPHLEKEQYCSAHKVKFRPANPDRQQLIDIIESVGNQSNGVLADAILAAGWGWLGK